MIDWKVAFEQATAYDAFLQKYGDPDKDIPRWTAVYERLTLTAGQQSLLAGFTRQMNVLCMTGAWCGDCVEQSPMLQRIAEAANGRIDVRFIDREQLPDVRDELAICGGNRIPITVFLSEDFHECARFGERTLAKYRSLAARQLGAACPTGLATDDGLLGAVMTEWIDQFERVQIMLRLSPRLRKQYGD